MLQGSGKISIERWPGSTFGRELYRVATRGLQGDVVYFGLRGEGEVAGSQLVMSTIPKRKYKRSDIKANYRNETKTF